MIYCDLLAEAVVMPALVNPFYPPRKSISVVVLETNRFELGQANWPGHGFLGSVQGVSQGTTAKTGLAGLGVVELVKSVWQPARPVWLGAMPSSFFFSFLTWHFELCCPKCFPARP
jgi:hypothetical protein